MSLVWSRRVAVACIVQNFSRHFSTVFLRYPALFIIRMNFIRLLLMLVFWDLFLKVYWFSFLFIVELKLKNLSRYICLFLFSQVILKSKVKLNNSILNNVLSRYSKFHQLIVSYYYNQLMLSTIFYLYSTINLVYKFTLVRTCTRAIYLTVW